MDQEALEEALDSVGVKNYKLQEIEDLRIVQNCDI